MCSHSIINHSHVKKHTLIKCPKDKNKYELFKRKNKSLIKNIFFSMNQKYIFFNESKKKCANDGKYAEDIVLCELNIKSEIFINKNTSNVEERVKIDVEIEE